MKVKNQGTPPPYGAERGKGGDPRRGRDAKQNPKKRGSLRGRNLRSLVVHLPRLLVDLHERRLTGGVLPVRRGSHRLDLGVKYVGTERGPGKTPVFAESPGCEI